MSAAQAMPYRSPAIDDYAKAIFALQARGDEPVTTSALAERLGITAGSVSAMLKKLAEPGLVTHEPYRGVRLTDSGQRLALEVIRHHRLLERFLADALGMPWDRVHAEAEVVLEHVISEELEELIMNLERDQFVAETSRPLARARLGARATAALWALRVFAVTVSAMVVYTFVVLLH
jgi:Mn-dependent DtxR family transcriptional regulator